MSDYLDYQQQLISRRRDALWRQIEQHRARSMRRQQVAQSKRPDQLLFSLAVLAFCCLAGVAVGAWCAAWQLWTLFSH